MTGSFQGNPVCDLNSTFLGPQILPSGHINKSFFSALWSCKMASRISSIKRGGLHFTGVLVYVRTMKQGKGLRAVGVKKDNKASPRSFRSEFHFSIDLEHKAILGQQHTAQKTESSGQAPGWAMWLFCFGTSTYSTFRTAGLSTGTNRAPYGAQPS